MYSEQDFIMDGLLEPFVKQQKREQERKYRNTITTLNKAQIIELGNRLPVYDDDDNVIGKTSVGDRAVVIAVYVDDLGEHAELVIIDGQYVGYDKMCIDKGDIKKARRVVRFDEVE